MSTQPTPAAYVLTDGARYVASIRTRPIQSGLTFCQRQSLPLNMVEIVSVNFDLEEGCPFSETRALEWAARLTLDGYNLVVVPQPAIVIPLAKE